VKTKTIILICILFSILGGEYLLDFDKHHLNGSKKAITTSNKDVEPADTKLPSPVEVNWTKQEKECGSDVSGYNDLTESLKWHNRSATEELNNHPNTSKNDNDNFLKYLTLSSSRNCRSADQMLALNYYSGAFSVTMDKNTSVELLKKCASEGDAECELMLGRLYARGKAVDQNYNKSFYFIKMAADNGLREAENDLGVLYFDGTGTKKDYSKALGLFVKASSLDDPGIKYNICHAYESLARSNNTNLSIFHKLKKIYENTDCSEENSSYFSNTRLSGILEDLRLITLSADDNNIKHVGSMGKVVTMQGEIKACPKSVVYTGALSRTCRNG
jgi:hypothetical protein